MSKLCEPATKYDRSIVVVLSFFIFQAHNPQLSTTAISMGEQMTGRSEILTKHLISRLCIFTE
jgi:hypothetical protein